MDSYNAANWNVAEFWPDVVVEQVCIGLSGRRFEAGKVLRSVEEETVDMVGPALVEATVEWIE